MSRGSNMSICCCYYKLLLLLWTAYAMTVAMASPAYRASFNYAKCTDAETGRELYVGEAFTRPGQCIRVQCLGTLQLWQDRCEVPKLEGNCSAIPPANEFLDYPSCCPLYMCKMVVLGETDTVDETRTYNQYGDLIKVDIKQIFSVGPAKGNIPGAGIRREFAI
uniref:Single domain-containing protein n=1 Tax=Ceratitis capitata TaxID=7213 RepID=W8C1P7_CERCA